MSTSKNALLDPAKSAKAVQLRYVNADMQGMHRTRKGNSQKGYGSAKVAMHCRWRRRC